MRIPLSPKQKHIHKLNNQFLLPKKQLVVMLLSNAYNPDDRVRNEALALDVKKVDVLIIAWDRFLDKPKEEIKDGIKIKRIRLKAGYGQAVGKFFTYFIVWILFLIQVIKQKPAIIHCHDFDTYFVGLIYCMFNKRTNLVFDAHENYYMMMKPLVPKSVSQAIAFLEKKLIKYADLVIGACDATVNYYREMGAKNTLVVGNWKDPSLYVFSPEQIKKKRTEIGCDDQLVVSYIGSLTIDRNVIPLVQAIQKRSWAYVIIGGTGGQESEIQRLCSSLSNAYYPGYIHPDDVPLYTSISDVIYYGLDSSDLYAPFNSPNKLFESLAAGKPIIASDLGGELSNIVKTTNCGILIPHLDSVTIGDALDKIADSNYRRVLESNSKRAGYTYNWQNSRNKLSDAYQKMFED